MARPSLTACYKSQLKFMRRIFIIKASFIFTSVFVGTLFLVSSLSVQAENIEEVKLALRQKQFNKAALLLRPLAKSGDVEAQYYLGSLYRSGRGVQQDHQIAYQWMLTAARMGQRDAQYAVATLYENGLGTVQDKNKAYYWYEKSAEAGHRQAVSRLKQLKNKDVRLSKVPSLEEAFIALRDDNEEMLKQYLSAGNSVNKKNADGNTLLAEAITLGADRCFKIILASSPKLQAINNKKDDAVSMVLRLDRYDYLEKLLLHQPNIERADAAGNYPIHSAVKLSSIKAVKALVHAGAMLNTVDAEKMTALDIATITGKNEIAEFIKKSSGVHGINYRMQFASASKPSFDKAWLDAQRDIFVKQNEAYQNWPLLHIASYLGKVSMVELLISNGADVSVSDKSGITAIERAIEGGNDKVVKILYNALALKTIDEPTANRWISRAIQHSQSAAALWLLKEIESSADNALFKTNLFMEACEKKLSNVLVSMLAKQHLFKTTIDNDSVEHLLLCASKHNLQNVVNTILLQSTDIHIVDNQARSALWYAAMHGNRLGLNRLVDAGAFINVADNEGISALAIASRQAQYDAVIILLNHGAELDQPDKYGFTPLMHAVVNQHNKIVNALIRAGAKIEMRDNESRTALMHASERKNIDIVNLLLASGANAKRKDKQGAQAIDFAKRQGHKAIARRLEEAH